jgi:DNA modification methylase
MLKSNKTLSQDNMTSKFLLLEGKSQDVLKKFPDNTFHTVVTSPPYWSLRDYFNDEQLGQESTPEEYVKNVVSIMREVKRTLRKDGTVWFNIGDSYNSSSGFCRATEGWDRKGRDKGSADKKAIKHKSIKQKDLIGMPWRVAFALQEDGWYLRCDIVWEKTNPMPDGAKDRPTRGHEYIFLLTKSPSYFYDYYRVLEDTDEKPGGVQGFGAKDQKGTFRMDQNRTFQHYGKRNKRAVWRQSVSTFQGDHFATYPPKLIEPCIQSGTAERGCCSECGTPWERDFEKVEVQRPAPIDKDALKLGYQEGVDIFFPGDLDLDADTIPNETVTSLELIDKGWTKNCECKTDETTSCLVLDPFNGTGTTGEVALKNGQRYVGIELNPEYLKIAKDRLKDCGVYVKEVSTIEEILE